MGGCLPLQIRRFPEFLFLPEKFSTQFQVPVPEISSKISTAPWNFKENLIISRNPLSFKIYLSFSINQINQIVYEFWKRLTRETTPFTKSGVALLESAFTNASIFPVSTSRLKSASDRSAFSCARSLWHV